MNANALTIARLGFLRVFRDRVALFFTFLLPVLIITLLSQTVRGDEFLVGWLSEDDGPLAEELRDDLGRTDSVELRSYRSRGELERAVKLEAIQGGVVVPSGYDADLRTGRRAVVALVLDPTSQDSAAVRSRVTATVAAQGAVVGAATFARDAVGADFEGALAEARRAADSTAGLDVETTTAGSAGLAGVDAKDYATVGELVLFLFLIGLTSAGDLVEARRDGTARRILATPTTPAAVIIGEGMARYAIALVQALFIVVLGRSFFGVSWGDPLGVVAVIAAFALVATSVSLLFGTLARTNEQATSLGPPVGIALAMLGGVMWPLEIVGPVLRAVGHLTPHAWALDAFVELMGNDGGLVDILPMVGVLLAFVAVLLPLATIRLHRAIAQ